MNISKDFYDNYLLVTITGDLRAENIIDIRESFEQLQHEATQTLLFDVSNMKHIDSSGIGLLTFVFKRVKPKGVEMVIIGLNGQPKTLFEMLRINKVFKCPETLPAYLQQNFNQPILQQV